MIKKRKKMIILSMVIAFIGINQVNAYSTSVNHASTGAGGQKTPREDTTIEIHKDSGNTVKKIYNCTYNYDISVNKNITINGYNYAGKQILEDSLIIKESDRVLSGTSIRLNLYEEKKIEWTVTKAVVTYTKQEKRKKYKCEYTNKEENPPQQVNNSKNSSVQLLNFASNKNNIQTVALNCNRYNQTVIGGRCPTYNNCNKNETYLGYTNSWYTTVNERETQEYKEDCETAAATAAKTTAEGYRGASYKVELSDSNNVNGTNKVTTIVESKLIESNEERLTGFKKYEYTYKQNKVCMNTLTTDVSYRNGDCQENEIEVKKTKKGDREFWPYFIPLEAKRDQASELNLLPADGGRLIFSQCLYVMQNNPVEEGKTSYVDLIEKLDGSNFLGDFYKGEAASDDYKIINNQGQVCVLTSRIKINGNQEFYNEVEKSNQNNLPEGESKYKLKGFNFYYKPIDITTFPNNSLASNSIWNEWNRAIEKKPNLTKSFDEVTYVAANINAKKVREYAVKINDRPNELGANLYGIWDKTMYPNGISKFIEDEGIVTRHVGLKSFYKLGCGPVNADWEECKR